MMTRFKGSTRRGAATFGFALPLGVGISGVIWALAQSPFAPIPGRDASALTGFAELQPFRPIGTPLWGAAVWLLSQMPIPLSVSIIVFQALLGGLSTGLMAALLLRIPHRQLKIRKNEWAAEESRDRAASALFGSIFFVVTSSFTLTFSYPRPEALSFALLVSGLATFIRYVVDGKFGALCLAAAFFSASAIEHVAALIICPLVALAIFAKTFFGHKAYARLLIPTAAGLLVGVTILGAGVYLFLQSPASEWREIRHVSEALRLYWREYLARGPHSLPRLGWIAIFAFTFLPLPFLLAPTAVPHPRSDMGRTVLFVVVLPLVAGVILFDGLGSPLRVTQTDSALPLAYAAAAVWAGHLFRFCLQRWIVHRSARCKMHGCGPRRSHGWASGSACWLSQPPRIDRGK